MPALPAASTIIIYIKLILYADNPDIVRERSGCSSRSLVPDTQLVAQLAGNLLDRGQGRGTVQATL